MLKEKTYSEIIAELESFETIRKIMLIMAFILLIIAYAIIKIDGISLIKSLLLIMSFINFIIPQIIKEIYRKKHILF